ncbi:MAG: HAD family hydrolase [Tunicatimonas sp.]
MPESLKIAVFDINGTLYHKTSKEEFFRFVCFRNSYKIADIYHLLLFKTLGSLRLVNQTQFKENFFNYLDDLPPDQVKQYAAEYWSIEYPTYFNETLLERVEELRKEGVQIYCISGGLDVYMDPLYELFPVDGHLSTRVRYEKDTYKIVGKACKEEEKIRRLEEHLDGQPYEIVEAYSDDQEAILKEAKQAYLVREDGKIISLS